MELLGKRIHFMGIGGIGVSALAILAKADGAVVSGCDREVSSATLSLAKHGIPVAIGHSPAHIADSDLLVYSSAIPPEHPERQAAGDKQEKRGQFLARFMAGKKSLGISGTHGKTTTSWLLAHILIQVGLDPSAFIGGIVPGLSGGNYRLGAGPFVAELDESDASFLYPSLNIAVITNIESDHLSHYHNFDNLKQAFVEFAAKVEKSGLLVANADDPVCGEILAKTTGKTLTFGMSNNAELRVGALQGNGGRQTGEIFFQGKSLGEFTLSLPGRHNMQNALAAMAVALNLGVTPEQIRSALATAKGVGRRLEVIGSVAGATLFSDYAHHPTEVAASIAALRQVYQGKILVAFQPHLFSRTRDYADEFSAALAKADAVVLADIYPAREQPIAGVSANLLRGGLEQAHIPVYGPEPVNKLPGIVSGLAKDFAAVVMMGAGDIDSVARSMVRDCPELSL